MWRCEGPHCFTQKRPRTFASALQSVAAVVASKNPLAKLLGRSPSTVSREMSRNGGHDRYRATLADESAWARARRPKCCKLANNPRLRQAVAGKLRLDWSPEQIAGWLKRTYPEDEYNQVSHET